MEKTYYVPPQSRWPLLGTFGLGSLLYGFATLLQGHILGALWSSIGALLVISMLFGWFQEVISESQEGLYNTQMNRSFRLGMVWFIFSEVMFFVALFGVLLYARTFAVPWLGGEGHKAVSHLLWPNFRPAWPLLHNPDPTLFPGALSVLSPWGIPAGNTLLLLSSGATITWAHWGLLRKSHSQLLLGLALTIALGILFICFQMYEYSLAFHHHRLMPSSGIYGSTFFFLTGFHGLHVTIGVLMLIVILLRGLKGHFSPQHHFAFEATAWYWHFVDVVWLFLFLFVYWL